MESRRKETPKPKVQAPPPNYKGYNITPHPKGWCLPSGAYFPTIQRAKEHIDFIERYGS